MAAFAVMLMAVLVLQAPILTVDRALHDAGYDHPANAFAGAVVDAPEHDEVRAAVTADSDGSGLDAAAPASHHHHHDTSSAYDLSEALKLPTAWSSSVASFRLADDLRQGIDASPQKRPPRTLLTHVA